MAWAGIALSLASAVMQAQATSAAGAAEEEAALARQDQLEFQAEQARINAGQEQAAAQRDAAEERKKGVLIESKALATGAASGVGVGSMEHIFGDIGAEAEYRSAFALYQGDVAARNLNLQADTKQFEGRQEARAGAIAKKLAKKKATGQLISGVAKSGIIKKGATLYEKYG